MKIKLSMLLLFITITVFPQNINLEGVWILDKITFENGNIIEINDPDFSTYSQYKFSNNKMEVNGVEVPITILPKKISTPALNIDYEFQDKYLLLKNLSNGKIIYLLKPESFVEMYPEFLPKKIILDDISVYEENLVIRADFNRLGGFDVYLRDFMYSYKDYPKDRNQFIVQFVVTKESKVTDIKVIKGLSNDFDSKLISYIKNSEKFFKNQTNKDFLIKKTNSIHIENEGHSDLSKEDRSIIKIYEKGNSFYLKNDFANAIKTYEQVNSLGANNENSMLRSIYVNLGVSYLATNKIESACESFNKAGGLVNFKSRNYIINFCNKK